MFGIRHVCYACTSPALASRRAANANFFWSKFASPPPPLFPVCISNTGLGVLPRWAGTERGLRRVYRRRCFFFPNFFDWGNRTYLSGMQRSNDSRSPPPQISTYVILGVQSPTPASEQQTTYTCMYSRQDGQEDSAPTRRPCTRYAAQCGRCGGCRHSVLHNYTIDTHLHTQWTPWRQSSPHVSTYLVCGVESYSA